MICSSARCRTSRCASSSPARNWAASARLAFYALALPAALLSPYAASAQSSSSLAVPMAVSWKYTGSAYANNTTSPAIAGNVAYYASGSRVYAVDTQSGGLKWQYPSDTKLATNVQTTPAVVEGTVYFGSGDGMNALDAATGKPRWPVYRLKNGVNASPVIVGDTLYFAGGNARLYALNTKTGEPTEGVWQQGINAGGDVSSDLTIANGMLYYITNGQDLHAVTQTAGLQRWTSRLPAIARNNMSAVVDGETIYVAAGNTITSLRASNGGQRWFKQLPGDAASTPALDDSGNVYVVTSNRNIYALDKSGAGLWHQAAQVDYEVVAKPIYANGLLIVGSTQGGVYAFDGPTGTLKWNYRINPSATASNAIPSDANVASPPVLVGDTLYVLTDDGTLTAFRHNAADNIAPQVTELNPDPGSYINGRPPIHFGARLSDDGSGLNEQTITLKVDDQLIPRRPAGSQNSDKPGFTYDVDDNVIDYITFEREGARSNALTDGHHVVTVTVKDWMGNTATKTWTFYVDDTIARRSTRPNPNQPGGNLPGGGKGRGPGGLGGRGAGGRGGEG